MYGVNLLVPLTASQRAGTSSELSVSMSKQLQTAQLEMRAFQKDAIEATCTKGTRFIHFLGNSMRDPGSIVMTKGLFDLTTCHRKNLLCQCST